MTAETRRSVNFTTAAIASLRWQAEMGVDEAVSETPIDRFAVAKKPLGDPTVVGQQTTVTHVNESPGAVGAKPLNDDGEKLALDRAKDARSLDELKAVVDQFEECALKRTATNTVFSDGNPEAGLMFIGEAPGAEEDRQGKPFVGPSGQLLDRMMMVLNMKRESDYYITNILPWRPPGNRKPTPAEQAMCLPFVLRQIELVAPRVLVFLGGTSASAILDTTEGITRLRGRWHDAVIGTSTIPAMPTYHPAYLLRQPRLKGDAWRDLLEIRARLSA